MKKTHVKKLLRRLIQEKDRPLSLKDFERLMSVVRGKNNVLKIDISELLVDYECTFSEQLLYEMSFDKDALVRVNAVDSLCIGESPQTWERLLFLLKYDADCLVRSFAVLSTVDIFFNMDEPPVNQQELLNFLHTACEVEKDLHVILSFYEAFLLLGERSYIQELASFFLKAAEEKSYTLVWAALHVIERTLKADEIENIRPLLLKVKEIILPVQRQYVENTFCFTN
ncbi:MAG: hypothetical protein IJN72_09180 [Firmicutes bacterium]|nr:hypothetical protein [Bacillota bacterium]